MRATGLLFLSKTRPSSQTATDGTFALQLYAVDRIGTHQVEPWVVLWSGARAEAFWAAHQGDLRPGCAIRVDALRMRAHTQHRAVPEIHAVAASVELVSTPESRAQQHHQQHQPARA